MKKIFLVVRGTKYSKNEIVGVFEEHEEKMAEKFVNNQGFFKPLYHIVEFELGV